MCEVRGNWNQGTEDVIQNAFITKGHDFDDKELNWVLNKTITWVGGVKGWYSCVRRSSCSLLHLACLSARFLFIHSFSSSLPSGLVSLLKTNQDVQKELGSFHLAFRVKIMPSLHFVYSWRNSIEECSSLLTEFVSCLFEASRFLAVCLLVTKGILVDQRLSHP